MTFVRTAASTLALGLALAAAPAWAQTAAQSQAQAATEEEGGVQDIVVTAQRRAERSQDVPIAISAFSGDQLRAQGVSNALQLGQFIPNLTALNNTGLGSANAYFLRGLGNTESIATFDPPVGTYVDDIYLSRQNANNLSLFDVERVEVLRGPQGTLFGRNTTGGAINVILRKPGKEFGGYAEVGYGRFNKKVVRASVDIPLADSFAIKLSGYYQNDKGYVKNVTTGQRNNDDDGWGARIALRGDLSDTARWNASYARIVSKGENLLNFGCDPRTPAGAPAGTPPPANRNCKGRFNSTGLREGATPLAGLGIAGRKANYDLGNDVATDLITSNLEFDLGPETTLSLITGYVNQTQQFLLDFFDGRGAGPTVNNPFPATTGFARGGFVITNDGQTEQFTQEIKVNGSFADGFVDYVVGAFYIHEKNRTDFADTFTVAPTTTLLLADRILRNKTEALAGYTQVDVNVTDQIKLTAGVRYTDERKSFTIADNRTTCTPATCLSNANLIAPNGVRIPDHQRAKLWTPRFAANFKPNDDILVFASATRGFKSGGWNARGTTGANFLPFDPEKVWSYEAGFKSDLFDRKLRVNLTAFWLDVKGLQTPAGLTAANGSIQFITRNFADYQNKGLELEVNAAPITGLNLFGSVGYQDDKYKLIKNAPAVDRYGIASVAAQMAACRQQRAAGQVPGTSNTAPAGAPVNNAPACAAGVVNINGGFAPPVRTPEWTIAFGGSYRVPLGGEMSLVPQANASWRSRQSVQTAGLSFYSAPSTGSNGTFPSNPFGNGTFITGSQSEAAWLVNGGLTLNGPNDKWSLTAECLNCFSGTFFQSVLNYTYINPPMTWMVRARYAF